jgi:hypothetical protein
MWSSRASNKVWFIPNSRSTSPLNDLGLLVVSFNKWMWSSRAPNKVWFIPNSRSTSPLNDLGPSVVCLYPRLYMNSSKYPTQLVLIEEENHL